MIKYDRELQRVWIAGKRIHHGLVGAGLIIGGAILSWHDRADWPWRLSD